MSLKNKNRILILFCFAIWPFGAALFAFYQMNRKNDFVFYAFLFSCFVGLYGYVFNARYDLSIDMVRIYNHYEMLRSMSFQEGLPFFILRGDLSLFTLWVLSLFGLNAQIVGFFVASLLCFSIILTFDWWMKLIQIRERKYLFIMGVTFCFLTMHPMDISGVRTPIAFSLFILGFMFFFINKKRLSLLFMILSVLNHFSMIFMVVLFLILILLNRATVRNFSFVLACSGMLFKAFMSYILVIITSMGVVGVLLANKINYYVFGNLAEGEVRIATGSRIWYAQLFAILAILVFIEISPLIRKFIISNRVVYKLELWIWLLLSFVLFNISNITMVARFSSILKFFCILLLISVVGLYKSSKLNKVFLFLFLFIIFIASIALAKERDSVGEFQIAYQHVPNLFYCNLHQLLNVNVDYINIEYQNLIDDV